MMSFCGIQWSIGQVIIDSIKLSDPQDPAVPQVTRVMYWDNYDYYTQ